MISIEKLQSNKYNDKDMINLSKELDELNEIGRKLHAEIEELSERLGCCSWQQENIPEHLKNIRKEMESLVINVPLQHTFWYS